jgi:hypothetical protein
MLYSLNAKHPDLQEEITLLFRDLQVEIIACDLCGSYHPPEMHLQPITPFDPADPEEA